MMEPSAWCSPPAVGRSGFQQQRQFAGSHAMQFDKRQGGIRRDFGRDCFLVMAVIGISGILIAAAQNGQQTAGASNVQSQGAPAADQSKPAESKPGGTRPTSPAPEPAHPDPEAQKQGAKAALPPAPAEKIAPPIRDK